MHSLALLDLCLVAESRADTWRRLALFESQEVYLAAIRPCLAVVNSLTVRIANHHRRVSQVALACWQAAREREGSEDAGGGAVRGLSKVNGNAGGGGKTDIGWPASGFNPAGSSDLRYRHAGGSISNRHADKRPHFNGTGQFMVRSEPSGVWRSERGMSEGWLSFLLRRLSGWHGGVRKGQQELGYLFADSQVSSS